MKRWIAFAVATGLFIAPVQAQNITALPAPSSGAVGGDLSGSLPNPVVAKINGTGVGAAATLGIGTGLASSGGNIILTTPVSAANGGTGTASGFASGAQRVLCSIRTANFNTTSDQTCTIAAAVTAWTPTAIWCTNASTSLTTAAGGWYPAASKAGTPLVAAVQAYTALSASTIVLPLTLAANIATTRYTINTVFLSLTLGNGGAATADCYLVGVDLT